MDDNYVFMGIFFNINSDVMFDGSL